VPPVSPALLIAHRNDLPGYARAKSKLLWTISAEAFVRSVLQDTPAEASVEIPLLVHAGFQEAVENYLYAPHRETDSETLVFNSSEGAVGLFTKVLSEDLADPKKYGVKQGPIDGVPGAVAFAEVDERRHDAIGSVLLVTGRCLVFIGDVVHGASARAQAAEAPVVAARPVYDRARGACA
jgi:hypothetical protein